MLGKSEKLHELAASLWHNKRSHLCSDGCILSRRRQKRGKEAAFCGSKSSERLCQWSLSELCKSNYKSLAERDAIRLEAPWLNNRIRNSIKHRLLGPNHAQYRLKTPVIHSQTIFRSSRPRADSTGGAQAQSMFIEPGRGRAHRKWPLAPNQWRWVGVVGQERE